MHTKTQQSSFDNAAKRKDNIPNNKYFQLLDAAYFRKNIIEAIDPIKLKSTSRFLRLHTTSVCIGCTKNNKQTNKENRELKLLNNNKSVVYKIQQAIAYNNTLIK